jgi:hypothetical protein
MKSLKPMKSQPHSRLKSNLIAILLTATLALGGVGCRKGDGPPAGSGGGTTTSSSSGASEPTGQEGGGWLARITGFQKSLEAKSAQVAAAEAAARQAEHEVQAMRVLLESQRDATHDARKGQSFWRVAASALGALAIVAVFAGAAIGSYARRQAQSIQSNPDLDDVLATLA